MPGNIGIKINKMAVRKQTLNRYWQEYMNSLTALNKQFMRAWKPAWKTYVREKERARRKYELTIQKEGKK